MRLRRRAALVLAVALGLASAGVAVEWNAVPDEATAGGLAAGCGVGGVSESSIVDARGRVVPASPWPRSLTTSWLAE